MELPLVEAAVPARRVEEGERVAALAHAHHGRLAGLLLRGLALRRADAGRQRALHPAALARARRCLQPRRQGVHERAAGVHLAGLHRCGRHWVRAAQSEIV